MSYSFKRGEALPEGLRRIAREELDQAMEAYEGEVHAAVHEVRKRCKKVRALLRLVRKSEPALYRRENDALRDLARALSELRDAHALVELVVEQCDGLERELHARLQAALEERRDARWEMMGGHTRLDQAIDALSEVRGRVLAWPLGASGWDAFAGGLTKTYRRGLKGLGNLGPAPSAEALHDLRKRSKYHRHHVDLLSEAWDPMFTAREEQLHRLTDLLGDDQDLARLRRVVDEENLLDERDRRALGAFVGDARRDLVEQARDLAQKLYAETPKAIGKRFGQIWTA